jgi:hypothetical protein
MPTPLFRRRRLRTQAVKAYMEIHWKAYHQRQEAKARKKAYYKKHKGD